MKKKTAQVKAYIAGFLDGEGCISITKAKKKRSINYTYVLNIVFAQKNPKILKWIQKYYGGRLHKVKKYTQYQLWHLRLGQAESFVLLQDVEAHCIVKKQHVYLGLYFKKIKKEQPSDKLELWEQCKQKMHELNKAKVFLG